MRHSIIQIDGPIGVSVDLMHVHSINVKCSRDSIPSGWGPGHVRMKDVAYCAPLSNSRNAYCCCVINFSPSIDSLRARGKPCIEFGS